MAKRHHHYVYVVLLSKQVLYERKFVKCNPDYDPTKPCVYVGMTGLDPDARFDKHKAGIRANRFVTKYGERGTWKSNSRLRCAKRAMASGRRDTSTRPTFHGRLSAAVTRACQVLPICA